MDITKMTVTELKALGYDLLVQMQQCQQNIQILNAEIAKRQAVGSDEAKPEQEEK